MTQKNKRGELSVTTPSGKIRNESKTERMKRYGKSTVHKSTKFDDGLLNASVDSKEKSKSKHRESLSFRKKLNKTIDENDEVDSKDNLKAYVKNNEPVFEGNMFMEFDKNSKEEMEKMETAKEDDPAPGKQWQNLAGLILRDENSKGLKALVKSVEKKYSKIDDDIENEKRAVA